MPRKRDAVVARCCLWTRAKVVKSAAQRRATVFDDRSYISKILTSWRFRSHQQSGSSATETLTGDEHRQTLWSGVEKLPAIGGVIELVDREENLIQPSKH